MRLLNRTTYSTKPILLVAVLMAIPAFTVAANAQPAWVGKFTLPYEVHWNHAVLPAGEYSIQADSKGLPAVLSSTSTNGPVFRGLTTQRGFC